MQRFSFPCRVMQQRPGFQNEYQIVIYQGASQDSREELFLDIETTRCLMNY